MCFLTEGNAPNLEQEGSRFTQPFVLHLCLARFVMTTQYFRYFLRPICLPLIFLVALPILGCDDETLGPQTQGDIEGLVQDVETDEPIPQANITTSPPTQSVLTNEDGTFSLEDVSTGNYTIEASKTGYESNTVTVALEEGQTVNATILLEPENASGSGADSLDARVTTWFNDGVNRDNSGPDSIFVDVEYSAINRGPSLIVSYEVYFEVDTSEGVFSYEVAGDSLNSGQRDIGGFRKYVPVEAEDVRVIDVYLES